MVLVTNLDPSKISQERNIYNNKTQTPTQDNDTPINIFDDEAVTRLDRRTIITFKNMDDTTSVTFECYTFEKSNKISVYFKRKNSSNT